MEIRSILVNVDVDAVQSTALSYAIDLARIFEAELIGIAADEPAMTFGGVDAGPAAVDYYSMQRGEIEKRLEAAGDHFRATVPADIKSQWRAYIAPVVRCLVDNGRLADLIVTSSSTSSSFRVPMRVDLGELVLASGRPIIDVGSKPGPTKLDTVVIAWKDTREARRAVADALPFLTRAKDVMVLTISEGQYELEKSNLDDIIAWLARHGVAAHGEVITNKEGFVDVLESTAIARGADLLVSGGYGHSRMREWLFGGMTRNLLEAHTLHRLFSN